MAKKMKTPSTTQVPGWMATLPVRARYFPEHLFSRYEGAEVLVVTVNRYGQATIKFLDGPRKNQNRGVKINELRPVPPTTN